MVTVVVTLVSGGRAFRLSHVYISRILPLTNPPTIDEWSHVSAPSYLPMAINHTACGYLYTVLLQRFASIKHNYSIF